MLLLRRPGRVVRGAQHAGVSSEKLGTTFQAARPRHATGSELLRGDGSRNDSTGEYTGLHTHATRHAPPCPAAWPLRGSPQATARKLTAHLCTRPLSVSPQATARKRVAMHARPPSPAPTTYSLPLTHPNPLWQVSVAAWGRPSRPCAATRPLSVASQCAVDTGGVRYDPRIGGHLVPPCPDPGDAPEGSMGCMECVWLQERIAGAERVARSPDGGRRFMSKGTALWRDLRSRKGEVPHRPPAWEVRGLYGERCHSQLIYDREAGPKRGPRVAIRTDRAKDSPKTSR